MPEQATVTIFTFDELEPQVQSRLIDSLRESYEPIYSLVYDEFIEDMSEKYGACIELNNIQWTGYWSQGDGASFTCEFDPSIIYPILKEELGEDQIDILDMHNVTLTGAVSARFGPQYYSHENTVQGSIELSHGLDDDGFIIQPAIEAYRTVMETKLTEIIRESSLDLYERLKDEYESVTTDEAIRSVL